MKPPSYLDPKKPKSDSHILTKIAHKTTKLAKNHLRSQLQRSRSGSSKDKSTRSSGGAAGAASSFFASLRKERSSLPVPDDDDMVSMILPTPTTEGGGGESTTKSSSSSYHFLGSPPMTPYHPPQQQQDDDDHGSNQADRDLGHFLRESIDNDHAFQHAPLDSPSHKGSRTSGGEDSKLPAPAPEQDESIAHSNMFDHQDHHQKEQYQEHHHVYEDDDDDDDESTEPLKYQHGDESSSALDSFFDEQFQKPSAKVFSAMDTQSVMTSDESIKERFLDETEKMTTAILNHHHQQQHNSSTKKKNSNDDDDNDDASQRGGGEGGGEQPSLVEMVAHVQRMSALLQRQTFRLQHKLGDKPASYRTEGDIKDRALTTPAAVLPQGTFELCKEVERLFENCDETLGQAFSRLEENTTSNGKCKNDAVEEYRKTFALEQVFLNDLRKGVTDVLAQYSMSAGTQFSADSSSCFVPGNTSLSSSAGDMLFDLPGFPTTAGDPDHSAGSILEESMLSVVFEDNSKSTSPSEQNQKLRLL